MFKAVDAMLRTHQEVGLQSDDLMLRRMNVSRNFHMTIVATGHPGHNWAAQTSGCADLGPRSRKQKTRKDKNKDRFSWRIFFDSRVWSASVGFCWRP
jgi:hypothetical protein